MRCLVRAAGVLAVVVALVAAYKAALWGVVALGAALGACDTPPASLLDAITTFGPPSPPTVH